MPHLLGEENVVMGNPQVGKGEAERRMGGHEVWKEGWD